MMHESNVLFAKAFGQIQIGQRTLMIPKEIVLHLLQVNLTHESK